MAISGAMAVVSFAWRDEFLVGVAEIDTQHRQLVEMIDHFYGALLDKKPARAALGELLRGLVEYTRYHFSTEEQLMAESQYPLSVAHRQQHEEFVRRVGGMVERFARGELILSIEATTFLREWLAGHILETDKQLGRHLSASRAR